MRLSVEDAAVLHALHPDAAPRAGDLVKTEQCDGSDLDRELNAIRRMNAR